jgi:hypothetical protein
MRQYDDLGWATVETAVTDHNRPLRRDMPVPVWVFLIMASATFGGLSDWWLLQLVTDVFSGVVFVAFLATWALDRWKPLRDWRLYTVIRYRDKYQASQKGQMAETLKRHVPRRDP